MKKKYQWNQWINCVIWGCLGVCAALVSLGMGMRVCELECGRVRAIVCVWTSMCTVQLVGWYERENSFRTSPFSSTTTTAEKPSLIVIRIRQSARHLCTAPAVTVVVRLMNLPVRRAQARTTGVSVCVRICVSDIDVYGSIIKQIRVLCRQSKGKVKCAWNTEHTQRTRIFRTHTSTNTSTHIHTVGNLAHKRIDAFPLRMCVRAQRKTAHRWRTTLVGNTQHTRLWRFSSEWVCVCSPSLCHKFAIGLISFSSIIHTHSIYIVHRISSLAYACV